MVVPFTSIDQAYKDWYNRQLNPNDVPGERWVYAVINDCVEGLLRGDNIPTILTLEEVKNGMIPLPKGYYEINQAMYVCYRKPIRRGVYNRIHEGCVFGRLQYDLYIGM